LEPGDGAGNRIVLELVDRPVEDDVGSDDGAVEV
jgi:hypothetical protein